MQSKSVRSYLEMPAVETFKRLNLYATSLMRFADQMGGQTKSPFIYPLYGLGELPQAFARLSAIYGGTYMLRKPVDEIVYEEGKAVGVKSEGEVAKCKFVVGDPSYFPTKVRKTGQVARAICIMSHPVPSTLDSGSCQIIIPQKQVGRKSDIYISVLSSQHNVAPQGKWLGIVSCAVETANPRAELDHGIKLFGAVDQVFINVLDTFEPNSDGREDQCFISSSYDATSHFETTVLDVLDMWKRITGKALDLSARPAAQADEE